MAVPLGANCDGNWLGMSCIVEELSVHMTIFMEPHLSVYGILNKVHNYYVVLSVVKSRAKKQEDLRIP
jgi:hypothetical protein